MNVMRRGWSASALHARLTTPGFIGWYLAVWWLVGVVLLALMPILKRLGGEPAGGGMSPDRVQFVMVFLGALGAILGCTMDFIADKRLPARSYFLRPAVGSLMALFIYFALRSGVFALSGDLAPASEARSSVTNANLFFFFAVMAGLFSRAAYSKLEQLSSTLFSVGDDAPPAALPAPAAVEAGAASRRPVVCRLAGNDAERMQAFRLRHRVLIEEEHWGVESRPSPAGPIVTDALDRLSLIAIVPASDRSVAATVRTTPLDAVREADPGLLERLLPLDFARLTRGLDDRLPLAGCSYTSRFVARKRNALVHYGRNGVAASRHTVATALATFLYSEGVARGVKVDFIRCFAHERRFYEHFGYRLLLPDVETIGWTDATTSSKPMLMWLNVGDRVQLEAVRSPFARYGPRDRQEEADAITRAFAGYRRERVAANGR